MLIDGGSATIHPEAWARDFVSWLSGWLGEVSVVDWAFIATALAILYLLGKGLSAVTRIGPVEVDLLDCDATSKAEVHALTANLRERLADSGLSPPPVVPAGAPQASLVAAVAASPIPQASWIAKLLELLPVAKPLQYKLSGTVFEYGSRPGIRYWLRPSPSGTPLMRKVDARCGLRPAKAYEEIMKTTAFEVYSFISTQAVQAFPTWARWNSIEALELYKAGCERIDREELVAALGSLVEAAEREPANALVRLQLANVYEQMATHWGSTRRQAEALREYVGIASEWPWLVHARYRASVLAATLVGEVTNAGAALPATEQSITEGLRLTPETPAGESPAEVVKRLARSESDAVIQLLKPWYPLLRWRQLRSQFEPTAKERRQLKRVVCISRQCRRVRSLGSPTDRWGRFVVWLWLRYSEVAVRDWHLVFGLVRVDWQTHYVAACFEALLLERSA